MTLTIVPPGHEPRGMDAQRQRALVAADKPDLIILDTDELNAETPVHLLDDDITPLDRLFVRNTGTMPALEPAAATAWTFTIDGCVRARRVDGRSPTCSTSSRR